MKPRLPIFLFLIPACLLLVACVSKREPAGEGNARTAYKRIASAAVTRILSPQENQLFTVGEQIEVQVVLLSDTVNLDSLEFYMAGEKSSASYQAPFTCTLNTSSQKVGKLSIRTMAWYGGNGKDIQNLYVQLRSDIEPVTISYQVENTYPHDINAYTQGLVFEDGFLYEGTGQYNESSLRKTLVQTGEAVRLKNLPGDIFGEGITILNDKIYQLTYKSQVGFVYEKESFRRLQKVYYQNKEGWGLTHDGENLIMSDGSHRIYFMDPEYFTELKQLEVYDNAGPVSRLNELEYIDGKIFANIYGEEKIVLIDPVSGKVTGRLNMNGLLTADNRHSRIDVFNGIAWDKHKRLLYVTGKYWPLLFEIRIKGDV